MNIAGLRKCTVTFFLLLLLYFTYFSAALAQGLNMPPEKSNNHPNISSHLQKLEKEYKEGINARRMVAQSVNANSPAPDKVTVYLMSAPGTPIDETALVNLGAQITKRSGNIIRAQVPMDMLTTVVDTVSGVSFMKTPDTLIPVATESQGVDLTGADIYHNEGYDGSGVKVAVIDRGFAGLSSAISGGELPNNVVKVDCTGSGCVSSSFSSETESHGTAVAEVVYDMAPGASLYLIKIIDTLDLAYAENYVENHSIRIVNHSLVVPNTNFYDGKCWSTNAVCTANDAYAHNILWVNAAGNQAQRHYEADFTDPDGDGWHNISDSNEKFYLINPINDSIIINAGDTIEVYLTWDAWNNMSTTDQDYDLYLFNSSNIEVYSSKNVQAGAALQLPTEKIIYSVKTSGSYYLKIRKYDATSNHSLELYSINHKLSSVVAASSLLSPADAAGVLAVGAIDYRKWSTGPQEPYSSQGPTNDGRIKPDIMGPDNVSNDIFGPFDGTSASCAHVTGAAALILDKNPGISVDQLRDALTSTATMPSLAREEPVPNNVYGYGRLNLDINLDINAAITSSAAATGDGGGGGGGCFIATAAFGSYAAPYVLILRKMRDRFLVTNPVGKVFVRLYYTYSPSIADIISHHNSLKILVRISLLPLVGISWVALKTGPVFTLFALLLVTLFLLGFVRFVYSRMFHRRRKTQVRPFAG